ncbi:MAG: type I DNA topoisomerase [Nitrospirae bacterium]|nr:type I DNA topoisomerase [Nitrospirota bacterium]
MAKKTQKKSKGHPAIEKETETKRRGVRRSTARLAPAAGRTDHRDTTRESEKPRPSASRKGSLIVVESPSKAKTITKYLGKGYSVVASVGHVKDLPKSKFGIDVEKGFRPQYTVIKGKKTILDEIKQAARKAERVYLAPDPDREGEAIAWHIAEELNGNSNKTYRVLFNEITEQAIRRALEHPGKVDRNKVNAQQARRILDRIVGYKISPLLWEKVRRGLSAGRVQSVAVRLVCDREKERETFVSEEYWSITAKLEGRNPPPFEARLVQIEGEEATLSTGEQSHSLVEQIKTRPFIVKQIEKKDRLRNPLPPFITSRLQQDAARKLRFSPKRTMMLAQQLYEGIEIGAEGPVGLITYMRTDSTRVAQEALEEARGFIQNGYGSDYLPVHPNVYKTKKDAQDAHEAIRPTSVRRTPESMKAHLTKDHYQLYKLIWDRFVASQMNPARLEMTRVDITNGDALFRANGQVVKFPGFTVLYTESQEEKPSEKKAAAGLAKAEESEADEERTLPSLEVGERLKLLGLEPKQHFTQPPPRYTEALLIKDLEEKGIGRPSTYHTILSTIVDRKYVEKEEGRLKPTDLGRVVNELLVEHFPDVLNVQFTARMETELDEIEAGQKPWVETVREFYEPFAKHLMTAQKQMRDVKREEIPTEIVCEKCGRHMVIKWGRHGRFLACPGYPDCKNTKEFVEENGGIRVVDKVEETKESCPKCGNPLVVKRGRFGRFLACSTYPNCDFTKAIGTGVKCPQPGCGGDLVEKRTRRGKTFFACSHYPKCTYALWNRPIPKACPECKAPFLVEKFDKRSGPKIVCLNKDCGYEQGEKPSVEPAVSHTTRN